MYVSLNLRWWFVIHGGIDGYGRKIVFLFSTIMQVQSSMPSFLLLINMVFHPVSARTKVEKMWMLPVSW
jgi:ABC-type dipeptide/oligopeptide/nickel transport system permease subunit